MRNVAIADIGRLPDAGERDVVFQLDEATFQVFYERTAGALGGYLSRLCGDSQQVDDLLQETYYRFLRANVALESDAHRRHYLFRIATNLVTDEWRRRSAAVPEKADGHVEDLPDGVSLERLTRMRTDLRRAMARLKPRERALLWLAYAKGSTHREISEATGLSAGSIKPLLFRARRRLAALLRAAGYHGGRRAHD